MTNTHQKTTILYQETIATIQDICHHFQRSFAELTLVAVSKKFPMSMITPLIDDGHRDFGENTVQEVLTKWGHYRNNDSCPDDIRLHFIGHLQSNKVQRYLATVSCYSQPRSPFIGKKDCSRTR